MDEADLGGCDAIQPADLTRLTVTEAARLIETRQISPVDLTRQHLTRIREVDPYLHAYLRVTEDRALRSARQAEAEIVAGHYRGRLHGIPFGLKDVYDTAGIPTTGNSAAFLDRVPDRDAHAVRRLDGAGAVLLGKQATHELTYGGVSSDLPWPPPRNPWDLSRDTGGSSSGSGAAVAAGLSMFALGTDTGGSVRNPAAHCGIVGLKPSFGLVSRSGIMANSHTLDHCGILARTVEDCAAVLAEVAGYDPRDPASDPGARAFDDRSRLAGGIAGWRIGLLSHLHERDLPASEEVRSAVSAACLDLARLGSFVEETAISDLARYAACKAVIQRPEIHAEYGAALERNPGLFGEKFRLRAAAGRETTAAAYLAAQAERRALTREITRLFERFDLLVTAGPYGPAPLLDDAVASRAFDQPEITVPFSLTRLPALCLCIGFTGEGLPLSLLIVGPPGGDAAVLRAGHAYQSATAWHRSHPWLPNTCSERLARHD